MRYRSLYKFGFYKFCTIFLYSWISLLAWVCWDIFAACRSIFPSETIQIPYQHSLCVRVCVCVCVTSIQVSWTTGILQVSGIYDINTYNWACSANFKSLSSLKCSKPPALSNSIKACCLSSWRDSDSPSADEHKDSNTL